MELFKLLGTIAVDNSGANSAIDDTTDRAEQSQSKIGSAFGKIGSAAVKAGKVIATGLAVGAVAITALGKQALDSYADFEQLVGGVETLFKESADIVRGYADEAYKSAGLSANEYMETVTSFSASLLQSLDGDTKAAADKANMAIIDMADNANKMGSSMESIQNAYQGFAKQNYTMLDNLKLGYGGTQQEMYRLMQDAAKLDKTFAKNAVFSLDSKGHLEASYSDIVDAIHIVQTEMGITGTTALEASSTISGSIASMKSAWKNLLTGLGNEDADLSGLIDNLVDSASTVADNVMPRVEMILGGIAEAIGAIMPKIAEKLPQLLQATLPSLIQGAIGLVNGLISALPSILSILIQQIPFILQQIGTALIEACGASDIYEFWYEVIAPAFMAVGDAVMLVWDALQPTLQTFTDLLPEIEITGSGMDYFREACWAVEDALLWVANKIAALSEWMKEHKKVVDIIVLVLGSLAAAFVVVNGAITVFSTVAGIASGIATALGTAIAAITSPIGLAVIAVTALIAIGVALYKNWDVVKVKCAELWQNVVAKFTAIKEGVASIIQQLADAVKPPINSIIGFINGLVSGVTSGINTVINALNRLQIEVPDWVTDLTGLTAFGFNLKTITAPQIPYLEKGGILEKGQVGLLEGRGAEAVVPLDRNSAWISRVADDMRSHGIGDSEIMGKIYERLNEMYALLSFNIPQMARMQVCLDTGALIGELAPGMDEALGELAQMDDRGV